MDTQYKSKLKKSNFSRDENMKTVNVVFSPEAKEVYEYLNGQALKSKIERTIFNAINDKIKLIKFNYHYGDPIKKELKGIKSQGMLLAASDGDKVILLTVDKKINNGSRIS